MSKTNKIGVFGALLFGIMMLLIPATSMVSAQENDRYGKTNNDVYYEDDRYYEEIQYNDRNGYYEDEYVYEEYYYPPSHKDKKKEPSMLIVKKDVLYCDVIANGTGRDCGFSPIPGPDSDRYVQECIADDFLCDNLNEATFEMIVTDNVEFPGSEEGKKLNFDGERYAVTEGTNLGIIERNSDFPFQCQIAGFDDGFILGTDIAICTVFEGECSGIIQDGELKECTVKNYVVAVD